MAHIGFARRVERQLGALVALDATITESQQFGSPDTRRFFLRLQFRTHAGEEEQVIQAYGELLKSQASLFLVVVPRHPERCSEVAALLERSRASVRAMFELAEHL